MQETLTGTSPDGRKTRYFLEVVQEGDHWVSTLARIGADGEPEAAKVAPKFYGTSAEQARRRMVTILENQYDEVRAEKRQGAGDRRQ